MIQAALERAFHPGPDAATAGASAASAPTKASVRKGGLEKVFEVKVGDSLACIAKAPSGLLAAATDDGEIVFIDGADGSRRASNDAMDDAPNEMSFTSSSKWLMTASDDGCARVLSGFGAVVFEHSVAEEPAAGKRARCVAVDHLIALADGGGGDAFVAAAGRLVHACGVPDGQLQHALTADSPIRALCAAPSAVAPSWAYAAAYQGAILLVSRRGEVVRKLTSERPTRSLAISERWLAAGAFDGTVELWDVATPSAASDCNRRLQAYCGSDGEVLHWSADGGGLAVSGARAAVFDFTGANPPHPYRKTSGAPGQPDPLPRVCMEDNPTQTVAWAPHEGDRGAATAVATVGKDGAVRLWRPRGLPLRKGGKGDPSKPQLMKPQFYTFLQADAAHPSGDAVRACGLAWLAEDVVAVAYATGELVAWRVAA